MCKDFYCQVVKIFLRNIKRDKQNKSGADESGDDGLGFEFQRHKFSVTLIDKNLFIFLKDIKLI